jgi:hypothetical protein
MNKPFLLIAADNECYSAGTEDWRGCFETEEQALEIAKKINQDWFLIVDLRKWMTGELNEEK